MKWWCTLFASVLLCLISANAFAESGVRGRVAWRGELIPQITVKAYRKIADIAGGEAVAVSAPTDLDGIYQLELAPGNYVLTASSRPGRFGGSGSLAGVQTRGGEDESRPRAASRLSPVIVVKDLHHAFAKPVLEVISFRVEPGEVVGYLGPNGAGKTTTLRILCGMLKPHSGQVEVAGFDPAREGFFWLAGQGGYGIQTAPAMGRLTAALATGAPVPEDLAALGITVEAVSPARFA